MKMDIDPDMLRYGFVVDLGQVLYHFLKDPYSWPATYLILDLYYFLLAPTLCYQLNFPRNVIIRKWFLARRALEIILLSQLMIAMIQQEMDMTAKIKHVMELVVLDYLESPIPQVEYEVGAVKGGSVTEFINETSKAKMTLLLGRFSSGNYGNCLVWLCVLVGPPIAVLTYLHDYYMLNRESNAWSLY
ncbi:Diacylglycerol O-acyltransferase 1 [Acipenser ruthenus]|uniref:diacylglycerol O-acyltransferase n=1 Tax=Acipenser ruthenus TaxID=7906 RepID=A0A444U7P6_ACIRT|nr:Diacylglycerol O-acyltransferase 1 [Acipenser ruthenus]